MSKKFELTSNFKAFESVVLIEAVKRYVRSETYPSVGTICSILGIEEGKKCETQSEKQKIDQ